MNAGTVVRGRMAMLIICLVLGLVILQATAVYFVFLRELKDELETAFLKRGEIVAAYFAHVVSEPLLTENRLGLQLLLNDVVAEKENMAYAFVVDPQGRVLAHTLPDGVPTPLIEGVPEGRAIVHRYLRTERGPVLHLVAPVLDGVVGNLHLGIWESSNRATMDRLHASLLVTKGAVLLLGVLGAILLALRITSPLRQLASATMAISKGDLDTQVDIRTGDELEALGDSFNRMVVDLRQARHDIVAARDFSERVFQAMHDGLLVAGDDGLVLLANPAVRRLLDQGPEGLIGRPVNGLFPQAPGLSPQMQECLMRARAGGTVAVMVSSAPLELRPGVEGCVYVVHDLSETRRVESERRTNRALRTIVACNAALVRAREEDELLRSAAEIIVQGGACTGAWFVLRPEPEAVAGTVVGAGRPLGAGGEGAAAVLSLPLVHEDVTLGDWTLTSDDPEVFDHEEVELLGRLAADLALGLVRLRDRSAHVRAEERLYEAKKLAAIGRLAGGIAHDFNNLVAVQLGACDLILKRADGLAQRRDDRLIEDVRIIRQAGVRAAALTAQLLSFGGRGPATTRVFDLNAVAQEMEGLWRRLIDAHIALEVDLAPGPLPIAADPGQIEQVLMNLVLNARDAMPAGGRLRIATRRVAAPSDAAGPPGERAELIVCDDGQGLAPEARAHLFEPYFTTKGAKGTGLGLATVYGIVTQLQGEVRVVERPEGGVGVHVQLPLADEAVPPQPLMTGEPAPAPVPAQGSVLLVEDEDDVREVYARCLRQAGYQVWTAATGAEALERVTGGSEGLDLLLTDLVMPGMDGAELARAMRALRPGMRVLLMTGYFDREPELDPGGADLLRKPFGLDELLRRVRACLTREGAEGDG